MILMDTKDPNDRPRISFEETKLVGANALCAICQISPCVGGGGDCCVSNGTPGCEDFDCCDLVCATDPFCCDSSWDNICANRAAELCPQCDIVPGDIDRDGAVGQTDLFVLFGDWGECFDCSDCPSDLDGDCEAGILDLFIVFANWN